MTSRRYHSSSFTMQLPPSVHQHSCGDKRCELRHSALVHTTQYQQAGALEAVHPDKVHPLMSAGLGQLDRHLFGLKADFWHGSSQHGTQGQLGTQVQLVRSVGTQGLASGACWAHSTPVESAGYTVHPWCPTGTQCTSS